MKDIRACKADETHRETGEGELREVDLDFEGLLPNGVEGIARDHLCLVLAAVPGNTNNLWQICTRFNSDLFAWSSFTCKRTHLNLDDGRGTVVLLADILPRDNCERDVRGMQPLLRLARRLEALVQDA